jgi:arginine-tRNA-protein transferase
LSAIYTFFDPDLEARSLGSYAIIDIIQRAAEAELPYVYLGYWIGDSEKMRYKAEFLPQQRLIDNAWRTLEQ